VKCLSVKQPYTDMILSGSKKEEFRSWPTVFTGELCIHASKKPDKKAMKKYNLDPNKFTYGCVLGTVEVIGVKKYGIRDYGWQLKNPKRFKEPIPHKGKLSFFEVKL